MGHGSDAGRSADMSARRTCWAGRRASGGAGLRSFTGGQRKWHRTRRAGTRDWETDRTASAEQLMDPAPTTLRPSDPLEKAKQMLGESDRGAVLVTDSDGKLLGAFFGANDDQEPGRKQELPDTEVWS
ncbi:MAG TPA: CBS domain-containing protein [Candidatus Binatia bacterium]